MPGRGKKRARESDVLEESSKRHKISHKSHRNEEGVVLVCGEGDVGQLGLGEDIMERGRPTLVKMDDTFIDVCAGGMHTVCLTPKGEIYTFGCNDDGALGRDTSEEGSEMSPGKVNLAAKIVQISAGDSHTAALSDEGKVYAWGNFRDASGSIGLTTQGMQKVPIEMLPNYTIVKIASGGDHIACLTDSGDIFTCGCAEQGQLGRISECFSNRGGRKGLPELLVPGQVRCRRYKSRKLATFIDIWAGQYCTYAQEKETKEIYTWGLNNYLQLGFDDMVNRFMPERIQSFSVGKSWVDLAGGQHHTVALDSNGKVHCLGRSEYGRLGLGDIKVETGEPTLVPGLQDSVCTTIAAGQAVSLAVTQDGDVYGWGMGTSKQLGTGQDDDELEPVKMKGKQLENRKVILVSSGGQHTVMLAKESNNNAV